MDKAIFQFSVLAYEREEVTKLSRKDCEHLANVDEEHVTKFDFSDDKSLQDLFNESMFDIDNCWFRIFI